MIGMVEVTRILTQIEAGDPSAARDLLPLVYHELRQLAAARMATERSDHTLQATALVHEAYLRLVGSEHGDYWQSRGHFFAAAAEAMRRILIDSARHRRSLKQGGGSVRSVSDFDVSSELNFDHDNIDQLIDLDEALTELALEDCQAAELVKLRVFAGLNVAEAARYAGIPKSTAYDAWEYVRAWFAQRLKPLDR